MVKELGSRLLLPYKSVGLITEDVPFCVNQLGNETFITVSLGRSFQVYKCDKLTPVMTSPQMHDTINCFGVQREYTFVGIGKDILVWKRVSHVSTLSVEEGIVNNILVLGEYLICTDTKGHIHIFNVNTKECIKTIFLGDSFIPSVLLHPNAYVNKVLVGSVDGQLQLWNIRKGTLIMKYKGYSSGITAIEQTPALDVVAVGLMDGTTDILNLQFDRSVCDYHQKYPITGISFRKDSTAKHLMATSDTKGFINLWDVEEKKLFYTLNSHPNSKVISITFIANQNQLVSIGTDNSIRMYVLDTADHIPRLLKHREGHMTTPNKIRFYGDHLISNDVEGGNSQYMYILSAGSQDRQFRGFHVMREVLNMEFSQGHVEKKAKQYDVTAESLKLPPILDFSCSESRAKDWNNIVTCHENDIHAYTWSMENKSKGSVVLTPPDVFIKENKEDTCDCVCLGLSGELCVCGYRSGRIHIFNMQSGAYRGSLPKEAKKGWKPPLGLRSVMKVIEDEEEGPGRHTSRIIGIELDRDNKYCISCDVHGLIKIWNILERKLDSEINVDRDVYKMALHRDSGLLAVACSDNVIYVYDIYLHTCVRHFTNSKETVLDMTYSTDGRWLLVSDESKSIYIFDIIAGICIDWCITPYLCTSLCFSSNSEFIACSYHGMKQIFIYANKAYFGDVYSSQTPKEPYRLEFPEDLLIQNPEEEEGEHEQEPSEEVKAFSMKESTLQNSIVLSGQPITKWTSLAYLDIVKERNKPITPPKEPEAAPFFLSTLPGLNPVFTDTNDNKSEEPKSRIIEHTSNVRDILTDLQTVLYQCEQNKIPSIPIEIPEHSEEDDDDDEEEEYRGLGIYIYAIYYFRQLSPSTIDKQLYELCSGLFDDKGVSSLRSLFRFFITAVKSRRDYELIQSILNRTLQIYGDILFSIDNMPELLKELQEQEQQTWGHLQELYHHSLCLTELFANIQM